MKAEIRYGKHEVSFYRTHPTRGLFAGRASIDVFGDNFMPAYTEGDNRNVVATDTMKNFVYAMALEYDGDRYEGFADFLARQFQQHYDQMQSLRVSISELPFLKHSDKLLSGPLDDDYESVEVERDRTGLRSLRCSRRKLRLIKLTGSAFKSFARDEFTTLPRSHRPAALYLPRRALALSGSGPRHRDLAIGRVGQGAGRRCQNLRRLRQHVDPAPRAGDGDPDPGTLRRPVRR